MTEPAPGWSASTPVDAPAAASTPGEERAIELQFWKSCCDRSGVTADDYRDYLERYAGGEFAAIARTRLGALTRPASPSPAASNVASISGTTWAGSYRYEVRSGCSFSGEDRAFTSGMEFRSGGGFSAMPLASAGAWTQNGAKVTVTDVNDTRINGVIEGGVMSGSFSWKSATDDCRGTFRTTRSGLEPYSSAMVAPRAASPASLSGTTWSGSYTYESLPGCTFNGSTNALSAGMQFKPDGTFYAHPLANDGQWTQSGSIVTVTGSNQTRIDGVINGASISGSFTWTAGGAECRGTFRVTRS